jgi:hypothetical protein
MHSILPWRLAVAVFGLLLLGALTGCAGFDEWARERALRPTPTQPAHVRAAAASLREGDRREFAELPGGERLALWWLTQQRSDAPTLLYLHGTFRNLYQNQPKLDALREAGYAILAVDYRGWGDSTPRVPSEDSILADADVAWQALRRYQPDPARRVIYGHSMGGAVAVALASSLRAGDDYAALVLEATFTSLPDVARAAGLVGRIAAVFSPVDFNSLARIGRVDAPVLMLHGTADDTVPIALGRRLRDALPASQVRWIEFEGGSHSRLQSEHAERYRRAFTETLPQLMAAGGATRKALPEPPAPPTERPR